MSASAGRLTAAPAALTYDSAARALLYILPLAVAFGSLAPLAVGSLRAGATDIIVAGLVALGAASLRSNSQARAALRQPLTWITTTWRDEPQALALLGALLTYVGVIILSVTGAVTRSPVIKETLKWGEVVVVVLATWQFIRTERQVLRLACAVVVAGVAEALLGCVQYVLASGLLGPGGANVRVFGTFDQPNPFGGYLNLALPFALAFALFGRDVRLRWVMGGASALLLFAEYLSGSRGALLGLAAALLVLVSLGWRIERRVGQALAVLVPVVALAWFTRLIPARFEDKLLAQFRVNDVSLNAQLNDANFSTIERLAHWVAGLRMFRAHPLLGVGAGNYDAAYARYKVPGWDESLTHAHNYYINAAAETGALGLLALLAVTAAALWVVWRATHASDWRGAQPLAALAGVNTRAIAIGCAAVVVGLSIHNLTDDLFVHAMELQFALTLGLSLRLAVPQTAAADAC